MGAEHTNAKSEHANKIKIGWILLLLGTAAAVVVFGILGWRLYELFALSGGGLDAGAVFTLLIPALLVVFAAACFVGALRRARWARAASIVLTVLLVSGATAMFQGIVGSALFAWILLALAVVCAVGAFLSRAETSTDYASSERADNS